MSKCVGVMTLKKDRDEVEIVRTPGSRGGEKE
jgi:hypothetical protein